MILCYIAYILYNKKTTFKKISKTLLKNKIKKKNYLNINKKIKLFIKYKKFNFTIIYFNN